MTLLALDTSTEWASVALYDGRDVLAEETWHAQRRHADELFPTIERLLGRTRITLASPTSGSFGNSSAGSVRRWKRDGPDTTSTSPGRARRARRSPTRSV